VRAHYLDLILTARAIFPVFLHLIKFRRFLMGVLLSCLLILLRYGGLLYLQAHRWRHRWRHRWWWRGLA